MTGCDVNVSVSDIRLIDGHHSIPTVGIASIRWLGADSRGNHKLQVLVLTTGVSVIMAGKYGANSRLMELPDHPVSSSVLDVELQFRILFLVIIYN